MTLLESAGFFQQRKEATGSPSGSYLLVGAKQASVSLEAALIGSPFDSVNSWLGIFLVQKCYYSRCLSDNALAK